MAPAAPPIQPAINGLKNLKFTPKRAGSVMPKKAESEEGSPRLFILGSLAFNPTARQAAPCAILQAEARGSQ